MLEVLLFVGVVLSLVVIYFKLCQRKPNFEIPTGNMKPNKPTANTYDVIIVGAGPAGSTAAYYLAKHGLKVALLERKQFPRDKYCGDAWCAPALDILEEMGVLQELESRQLCHKVEKGGFISPFGYKCVNDGSSSGSGSANNTNNKQKYGSAKQVRTYAIKRIICDEFVAKKAVQVGAQLFENTEVNNAILDENDRHWRMILKDSSNKTENKNKFIGRMLIIADGSNSFLGKKLGIINGESRGICSRHYIKGGTHNCEVDGVIFYAHSTLPGYSAIFRHYNNDLYLGTYILPGGQCTARDISKIEASIIKSHPVVKQYFGAEYEWRDKMKIAPLRLFGDNFDSQSYGRQVLVIGDAAAQIDPLTGEGIHTAMIAAKIGAETIIEMFAKNNFGLEACRVYESRWMDEFGNDFYWSYYMAKVIYKFPILLDAMSRAGIQQGQSFLDEFGMIMTGVKSKITFLYPANSLPILVALVMEIVNQYVLRNKPIYGDFADWIIKEKHAKQKKKRKTK